MSLKSVSDRRNQTNRCHWVVLYIASCLSWHNYSVNAVRRVERWKSDGEAGVDSRWLSVAIVSRSIYGQCKLERCAYPWKIQSAVSSTEPRTDSSLPGFMLNDASRFQPNTVYMSKIKLLAAKRLIKMTTTVWTIYITITLLHQLNGSIKICLKSTLINTTQQQTRKKKKKNKNLG